MYSAKGRRKCGISLPRLGSPRVMLFLATLLLIATTVLLVLLTRFDLANPVVIVEQRNYGIVVDAGSSSSKIHLFQWPLHDGDPDKLLTIKPVVDELGDPRIKKVEPGIATFARNPETAFTSIQPLLEFALSHIPSSHHQHTQLYIFCTAGMRLLPQAQQNSIVQVLYERVSTEYPFHLPEGGVQVISGKLEGVFSWITINYLLDRLNPEYQHVDSTAIPESGGGERPYHAISTVGSLDMGGASLQVAFEIPHGVDVSQESTVDINLGCGVSGGNQHKHRVFVSTYLGYGANEARSRYHKQLLRTHLEKNNESHLDAGVRLHTLRDPCAPLEHVDNITIDHHSFKIRGLGSFDGCKRALLPLLQSSGGSGVPCPESDPNCSLIHIFERPPLFLKYETLDFYGTSEFWYTMRDVLRIGGHYTSYSFVKASTDFCQTNWRVLMNRYQRKLYMYADFNRLKTQCMKSAWLSLVLHEGLGFPPDSISLHSLASIEGQSVQWALGALLYNTRYLPLREVQLHQLQAPPLSRWQVTYFSSPLQSSFLLPFLMVLCVAFLLLCCRQRRPHLATQAQPWSHPLLHRTQSLNSLVKIHRRSGSVVTTGSSVHVAGLGASDDSTAEYGLPRNDWSESKLKFVV